MHNSRDCRVALDSIPDPRFHFFCSPWTSGAYSGMNAKTSRTQSCPDRCPLRLALLRSARHLPRFALLRGRGNTRERRRCVHRAKRANTLEKLATLQSSTLLRGSAPPRAISCLIDAQRVEKKIDFTRRRGDAEFHCRQHTSS